MCIGCQLRLMGKVIFHENWNSFITKCLSKMEVVTYIRYCYTRYLPTYTVRGCSGRMLYGTDPNGPVRRNSSWCMMHPLELPTSCLTHWGRVTHICVNKIIIIGSDNGLAPGLRQAIIWTNDGMLLIGNKLQWNIEQNQYIFIQGNEFENVVC